jgi:hypothetical protein
MKMTYDTILYCEPKPIGYSQAMNINLSLTEEQAGELYYALSLTIYRRGEQIDELKRKGKNKNATTISIFQKDKDVLQGILNLLPIPSEKISS